MRERLGRHAAARLIWILGAVCASAAALPRPSRGVSTADRDEMAPYVRLLADRSTRAQVARRLGREQVRAAVEPIRAAARDADPEIRAACLWALGEIGDPSAASTVRFYVTDEDAGVRLTAVETLGKLGGEEAARGLEEALAALECRVRLAALDGLAACDDDGAHRSLVAAMSDDDRRVRGAAAEHIIRLGAPAYAHLGAAGREAPPRALERVLAALRDSAPPEQAVPWLLALLSLSDPGLRPHASKALRSVREGALAALVAVGDPAVEPVLDWAGGEEDGGPARRRLAGAILRRIDTPAVVAAITRHVFDKDTGPDDEELAWGASVLAGIGSDEAEEVRGRITRLVGQRHAAASEARLDAQVEALRLTAGRSRPPEDPSDAVLGLVLAGALPGGKPLTVHLDVRDGRVEGAFGTALTFNLAPHDVDASGLAVADGRADGTLDVTIQPDPYVPRDGRPIACVYEIQAGVKAGAAKGSFSGGCGGRPVSGEVRGLAQARPAKPDPAWFHLLLEDGMTGPQFSYHHRAYVSFTLHGDTTFDGRITEFDQRIPIQTSLAWNGLVEDVKVRFTGDRLTGSVHAVVTSSRDGRVKLGRHTFPLEGLVIGRFTAGRFKTVIEGTFIKAGRFVGEVRPADAAATDFGNRQLLLELEDGLGNGRALRFAMTRRGGRFHPFFLLVDGVPADVDVSGLGLRGRTVSGTLRIALPTRDGGRTRCVYELEADVRHSRITGGYEGKHGEQAVGGSITGRFGRLPE